MANQKLVNLLRQERIEEFNSWRIKSIEKWYDLEIKADGVRFFVDRKKKQNQNKFRKKTYEDIIPIPGMAIDLKNAELGGCNLTGVNFFNVNLEGANLESVDLNEARLDRCNFRRANLKNAKITGKNRLLKKNRTPAKSRISGKDGILKIPGKKPKAYSFFIDKYYCVNITEIKGGRLDFSYADLSGADLSWQTLSRSIFTGTNLKNTDFNKAVISGTSFIDVNLNETQNLGEVISRGPSIIDHRTLKRSQGRIPRTFLSGCGLSDWEIKSVELHDPNLTSSQITDIIYELDSIRNEKPIQFHNLFISYSHHNGDFVDALQKPLDEKGVRFWRDKHHATSGPLESIVLREMSNRVVLLILSEDSINSDWVEFEIQTARRLEKEFGRNILCPITIDKPWKELKKSSNWSRVLVNQIDKYNVLDFSDWHNPKKFTDLFERLLKGLDIFYEKPD